jgi:hypothetical protein
MPPALTHAHGTHTYPCISSPVLPSGGAQAADSPLPVLLNILKRQPVHNTFKKRAIRLGELGGEVALDVGSSWKEAYSRKYKNMKVFIEGQVREHEQSLLFHAIATILVFCIMHQLVVHSSCSVPVQCVCRSCFGRLCLVPPPLLRACHSRFCHMTGRAVTGHACHFRPLS